MDSHERKLTLVNESEIMDSIKKEIPCKSRKGYLGQTLREFRKSAGMTQANVAAKSDMSVTHYINYEQGQHFPDTDRLIKICRSIGVDPLAVFAAALDRCNDGMNLNVPIAIYEDVAEAFHNKIDEIAHVEKDLTLTM